MASRPTKVCPMCNTEKKRDEFTLRGKGAIGGYCQPCFKTYHNARYVKWYSEPKNKATALANQRKMKYGITVLETHELMADQEDRCAICKSQLSWRTMNVDHDHKGGKVRGLLCSNCNRALGCFNDDPRLLMKAAEYLRKHEES